MATIDEEKADAKVQLIVRCAAEYKSADPRATDTEALAVAERLVSANLVTIRNGEFALVLRDLLAVRRVIDLGGALLVPPSATEGPGDNRAFLRAAIRARQLEAAYVSPECDPEGAPDWRAISPGIGDRQRFSRADGAARELAQRLDARDSDAAVAEHTRALKQKIAERELGLTPSGRAGEPGSGVGT